jgi:dTDP-4-dehydrorhamnose 3,5-epimerase
MSIEEARLVPLKRVVNARGYLQEVQRSDDPHFPGFGQAYITCTLPGVVKAWYRHARQFDQIALVQGQATVVLYDAREASATRGRVVEWVVTDEEPALMQIPPGVWHGFMARGATPLLLLHLNSVPHDAVDTDEERRAADSAEIPYTWR